MRKALIVGINEYRNAPLKGCINDATTLASILRTNGNGSPNFGILQKLDVQTRGELRSLIEELFKGDHDAALFYFSGHGYIDITGGKLVTPDYTSYDEGISMQDIMTLANNSKIKNRIIILDCCHSGALGSTPSSDQHLSSLAII